MVKEEYNCLNNMMDLERENAKLRLEVKKKEKLIQRLKEKIKKLEGR